MDDFIKAMEGFIAGSNKTYQNWPYKQKIPQRWIECCDLFSDKWQITEFIEVNGSDDIMIKWAKGDERKETILKFSDQVMWLKFLEQRIREK